MASGMYQGPASPPSVLDIIKTEQESVNVPQMEPVGFKTELQPVNDVQSKLDSEVEAEIKEEPCESPALLADCSVNVYDIMLDISEEGFTRPAITEGATENGASVNIKTKRETGQQKEKCDTSGEYLNKSSVSGGRGRVHTWQRPLQCEMCLKSFGSRSSYRQHVEAQSCEQTVKHQCEVCQKYCWSFVHLARHRRKHIRRQFLK